MNIIILKALKYMKKNEINFHIHFEAHTYTNLSTITGIVQMIQNVSFYDYLTNIFLAS
jgi:hypothetical protein